MTDARRSPASAATSAVPMVRAKAPTLAWLLTVLTCFLAGLALGCALTAAPALAEGLDPIAVQKIEATAYDYVDGQLEGDAAFLLDRLGNRHAAQLRGLRPLGRILMELGVVNDREQASQANGLCARTPS